MSCDGWLWYKRHADNGCFRSPLEALVGHIIADGGGLCERSNDCAELVLWKLAADCRCTEEEAVVALWSIARQTGCNVTFYGSVPIFKFRVPEYRPAVASGEPAPASLRAEMNRIRPRLIKDGFLDQPCEACGDPAEHVDHIIPLSRGGTNEIENLQPLCAACNLRKSNMTMEEFMDQQFGAGPDDEAGHA